MHMRTTVVCPISLPPDLVALADQLAREEHRTRSELFREALRQYARMRKQQGTGIAPKPPMA